MVCLIFFLLSVRQFRLKEPSRSKGLFVYGAKTTDCLASPRLRRPRDYYSLRVQSLRCRLRNKARNRQTMISCLDLYRAGFRVGPGLFLSLSLSPSRGAPLATRTPQDGTSEGERNSREGKEERIEAAPREVRLRDEVDPRGGDLSVLTEKGYLHQFLLETR